MDQELVRRACVNDVRNAPSDRYSLRTMNTYLLKKFDKVGQLKGYGELHSDEDDEVVAWATQLPRSYTYELWQAERLIYASENREPSPAATPAAALN
jgi:hypothetical protein